MFLGLTINISCFTSFCSASSGSFLRLMCSLVEKNLSSQQEKENLSSPQEKEKPKKRNDPAASAGKHLQRQWLPTRL